MIGAIASHYVATVPTTYSAEVLADSPLAYWRLGEASGTTMTDASPNGRNGTYTGSPTLGVAGAIAGNTAIELNGTGSQYGSVAYGTWMNTASVTVEAWVKPDVSGRIAVSRASNFGTPWSMVLQPGGLSFVIAVGTTEYGATGTAAALYDGAWHHVVGTYDGETIRAYEDGVQVAVNTTPSGAVASSTNPIRIGRRGDGQYSYDGVIDEVAVYGSALSAARIAAHYAAR